MILGTAAAILSAWLLGALCIGTAWPRERLQRGDAGLILWLGLGAGFGLTSFLYLAASLVSNRPAWICLIELLVSAALAHRLWSRRREFRFTDANHRYTPLKVILQTLFIQGCIVSGVVALRAYQTEPFSSSDGWTIWNMHARIIHRSGTNWPDVLGAPQLLWTHPDYPLLVPLSVARCWAIAGSEAPFVAGLVSVAFGMATLGVLVSAVTRLRDHIPGYIGGLVLLGTPFFVTFSANQHADIPLGFYLLASVVLITVSANAASDGRVWALAGSMAGLAAWTKNEGLLFVLLAGVGCLLCGEATSRRRTFGGFLAGLAFTLIPVAGFKLGVAPVNDIVASNPWSRWPDLLDWNRHRLILAAFWRDAGRFGEWYVAPFLAMLLPLVGRPWPRPKRNEWVVAIVLGLVVAGYYSVYLLTPMDLEGHLSSSLVRLLIQLWPAVAFFWCLLLPHECSTTAATSAFVEPKWTSFTMLGANVALAAAILILFGRQLPANQLSATRLAGGTAGIFIGDGWFGPERHGHDDVWAWSRGESSLIVRIDAPQPVHAALQFTIRALGPRTVVARVDNESVWEGRVDDTANPIRIPDLHLPPGNTRIDFHTATPGLPESDDPNARKLTFAIYNPIVTKGP